MTEKGSSGRSDDRRSCNAVWEEKRSVERMSYREGRRGCCSRRKSVVLWIQEEGICLLQEKRKRRRREAHQPGREQASQGLFTWIDHASGSLSLVYLSSPLACPTKVTSVTKESPLVPRSSPLHRFGRERFPIGPDSGTNDATMRHSSLRGKLPLHLTLSLVCACGVIMVRDAVPATP